MRAVFVFFLSVAVPHLLPHEIGARVRLRGGLRGRYHARHVTH